MCVQVCLCVSMCVQLQYKQEGKKEAESNLYSLMPQTLQTERAKDAYELQSQVCVSHHEQNDRSSACVMRKCVYLLMTVYVG